MGWLRVRRRACSGLRLNCYGPKLLACGRQLKFSSNHATASAFRISRGNQVLSLLASFPPRGSRWGIAPLQLRESRLVKATTATKPRRKTKKGAKKRAVGKRDMQKKRADKKVAKRAPRKLHKAPSKVAGKKVARRGAAERKQKSTAAASSNYGSATLDQITQIAAGSPIARFHWTGRGLAPAGYLKGMSLVFARVYCKLKSGDFRRDFDGQS